MTKQIRYPIEALALAMVLFSSGMKEAMIVGIGLVFGHVLQSVLRENFNEKYSSSISALGALITGLAIYGMMYFTDIALDAKKVVALVVLGLLFIRNDELIKEVEEYNYNKILVEGACGYGIYVLIALIKEYISKAQIFGFDLYEPEFVSASFGKVMFSLIFAGIGVAIVNRVLKIEAEANAGLWVCLPVIFIEAPFVMNNVNEIFGTIIGIVMIAIIYVTLRKKLLFSETEKHIEELPVELVLVGFLYMIFSLL